MKEYKNPEIEMVKLATNDLLMTSNESAQAPFVDPIEQPNGTPSVPLF